MKISIILASWLIAFGACAATIGSYPNATTPLTGSEKMISTQGTTTVNVTAAMISAMSAVSVANYGAKCDGTTDDTIAIQSAINASAAGGWFALGFPGMCKITSSLIVDRLVGTMTSELRFMAAPGTNGPAGISTTSAIQMFASTYSYATAPQSERIGFYNLTFKSTVAGTYLLSPAFLRVHMDSDQFQIVALQNTPIYSQSLRLENSYAVGWSGWFMQAALQGYDIKFVNDEFEGANGGVSYISVGHGDAFIGNVAEGLGGPFLQFDGINGADISGNYTEGNIATADYIFACVSCFAVTHGVTFNGNFVVPLPSNCTNPAYYSVIIGLSTGSSSGNYSNCRLFDDTATTGGTFFDSGSWAAISLTKSGNPINLWPRGISTTGTGNVVFSTGSTLTAPVTFAATGTNQTQIAYSGTTSYAPFAVFAPSLPVAGFTGIETGVANTNNNAALLLFNNIGGSGSASNTLSFGVIGNSLTVLTAGGSLSTPGGFQGAVGNISPNTGLFTTLTASSTVSGAGFTAYLASPPAIGATVAGSGAFTTLSASSTVSGTGFSTYLASPPAIGGTTPAAGAFTTVTASGVAQFNGPIRQATHTVATLPASPTVGQRDFVTDATACTFATAPTGGGAVGCPVYYDGAWKEG